MIISRKYVDEEKDLYNSPNVTVMISIVGENKQKHTREILDNIKNELTEQYNEQAATVIEKLDHAFLNINYNKHKKTAVIIISPVYENILYLDVPLEEKISVDEPFEIRDLVNKVHPSDKYLLLVQSAEQFKIFLGDRCRLLKIALSTPSTLAAYDNDIADRIENFSDPHERKEVLLDKFIGKIDKELTDILHKYPLPVIVVGPEKMNGHFKKHTHNEHDILKFIHGNYDHAKPHQLIHLIQPHLAELKKIEHIELASIISHASDSNKISWGIKDVWQNVMKGIGKLLLVEKSYTYRRESAERQGDLLTNGAEKHGEFIRDGIDILIEEVLNSGGEVRFVDHDVFPSDYKIALIHYYSQKSY